VPLLGRLIRFVADRHEVMATFAVCVLLEDDGVAGRFTAWLAQQGGVELPAHLTYRAEASLGDGRVDIAGEDGQTMWVVCEAKFGAPLGRAQLAAYADATPRALLVVIVPEPRRSEGQAVLDQVLAERSGRNGVVVSWEQVCDALADAGAGAGDVEQLRALCRASAELDVAPLREEDLGAGRLDRRNDLERIAEQVTLRLHARLSSGRVYPTGEWGGGFTGKYRYVAPIRCGDVNFAVGVRAYDQTFERPRRTPFWMRWHRDTGHDTGVTDAIEDALRQAGEDPTRDEDGHLWMPLHPRLGVGGEAIVEQLVGRALELHEITRPPPGAEPA
jgi:hypothetical protein